MFGYKDIDFITHGIDRLGTAIFSNDSKSVLKFPTSIIRITGIDTGLIWFTVKSPYEDMNGLDWTFPAQLQFYRKHCDYHIVAFGEATIILDGHEYTGVGSTYVPVAGHKGDTLIRFKVGKAEYHSISLHNHMNVFMPFLLSPFSQ